MSDFQHKEWFIAALVPHIRQPLMQQNIVTQNEALEIVMKLEASPIGETAVSINQIQEQLANLTLQLQDTKKEKEEHDYLWCTWCHMDGHTKDTYPNFWNYFLLGAPNPLIFAGVPWCRICQVYGHRHKNYSYMKNMVTKAESLYYSFCRLVGHEKRTYDSYFVKRKDPHMIQQSHPQMVQPTVQYTPPLQMQFILSQSWPQVAPQPQFVAQPQFSLQPQYN